MSAYPELKSEPIIIEETNAMYPKLPNEQPPAYTAQPMAPIGAPPTLCAQCTNTVVVPVDAPPANTTVIQSSDFCRRCCRAKRRMLRKLARGRFCECRSVHCCK